MARDLGDSLDGIGYNLEVALEKLDEAAAGFKDAGYPRPAKQVEKAARIISDLLDIGAHGSPF